MFNTIKHSGAKIEIDLDNAYHTWLKRYSYHYKTFSMFIDCIKDVGFVIL